MTHIYTYPTGAVKLTIDDSMAARTNHVVLHSSNSTENGWVLHDSIAINVQAALALIEQLNTFVEMSRRPRKAIDVAWWVQSGYLYVNNACVLQLGADNSAVVSHVVANIVFGTSNVLVLCDLPKGLSDVAYESLISGRIDKLHATEEF